MESCDARRDKMFSSKGGWWMKIYRGPANMVKMPDSISGMSLIGKKIVRTIDLQTINSFRQLIAETPDENFVWVFGGTVNIEKEGEYTMCTKSDDGSKLYVHGELLVNNDGLHGPEQKCKVIRLSAGKHRVTAVGFQHGGGAFMQVTYRGADTNNQEQLMKSVTRRHSTAFSGGRGWVMKIFQGPRGMTRIPEIAGLKKLGSAVLRTVDLRSDGQFRDRVLRTPSRNYVWAIGGTLQVLAAGDYNLCIKSDDGSKLYVNGNELVDNDGLHGPTQKCGKQTFAAGLHKITATGFQRGGGAWMDLTYSGPDTNNQVILMRSAKRRYMTTGKFSSNRGWFMTIFRGPTGMSSTPDSSGLSVIGTNVVKRIRFHNDHQFRVYGVRGTPNANYVWSFLGTLNVKEAGRYKLCIKSDDGSKLFVGQDLLVDNDGLHGPLEKCADKDLAVGKYDITVTGFQREGGAFMDLTYEGPDTKNKRRYMRSYLRRTSGVPASASSSSSSSSTTTRRASRATSTNPGWLMKVYEGPQGMDKVPKIKGLKFLGKGIVQQVKLTNPTEFRTVVKETPNENFVWVISGVLVVSKKGTYTLCTKSDDGSRMYVNAKQVVNNDGLHGAEQKCGDVVLSEGRQFVTATGFQRGGGAHMEMTYKCVSCVCTCVCVCVCARSVCVCVCPFFHP
jgi:hypothetical protein